MSFANFAIEAGVNASKPPEPAPAPEKPATTPAAPPVTLIPDAGPVGYGDNDADTKSTEAQPVTSDTDTDDSDGGAAPAEAEPPEGVPETPEDYVAPQVEGVEWNSEALSPVLAAAHEHGIPQEAVAAALEAYAHQIAEQQAALKRQDRERMAEVRQKLTPSERGAIDAASQTMSRELRTSIRQARLPSGELLLHSAEFLSLLANLNRQPGATNRVAMAQNDAALEETARLHMRTDIEKYYREKWDQKLAAILNRKGTE